MRGFSLPDYLSRIVDLHAAKPASPT